MTSAKRATSHSPADAAEWSRQVRRFIEAGGNTTHAFGLGRLIGRMFALLYLHPRPLSLEEIASLLEISKASASMTARQLAEWRAVRLVQLQADRRDYYEAETQFRLILKEGLLPGIRKKLQSARLQINRTLAADPSSAPATGGEPLSAAEVKEIRRRLRAARDLHGKLDGVLGSPLLDRLL